jgi:hypothetical protein
MRSKIVNHFTTTLHRYVTTFTYTGRMPLRDVNYKCLYRYHYVILFSQSCLSPYNNPISEVLSQANRTYEQKIFLTLERAMSAFRISLGRGTVIMKLYTNACSYVHEMFRNHNPTNHGLGVLPANDNICNIHNLLINVNKLSSVTFSK